jgi:adenosylhomocysteine nucleosidase
VAREVARWGVVAALPEEIAPVRQRLTGCERVRLPHGHAMEGRLQDRPTIVTATGDGANLARLGMEQLLGIRGLEAVIVIGIAGGLSDDLEVGSVVAAQRVFDEAGELPVPDPELLGMAAELKSVQPGMVFSHSEIAVDPLAKQRLWHHWRREKASVVDLESASYVRVAAAHGIPYLVLRAVSDSHDEALPLDFNMFRKPDGSSDRAKVLRYSLRHPSILPELMQLRERLRHCAERLAILVEELLTR